MVVWRGATKDGKGVYVLRYYDRKIKDLAYNVYVNRVIHHSFCTSAIAIQYAKDLTDVALQKKA